MSGPFFIVGCGRSGTTLLRGLLDRHPDVAIPLESLFMVDYLRAARDLPAEEWAPLLAAEPEIEEWGLKVRPQDFQGGMTVPEALEELHLMYARQRGKRRWGQKTPRFVRYLDLLAQEYPAAKFVHLIRDPRAVTSSLIRSDVHNSNALYAARRWLVDVGAGLQFEERHAARIFRLRYEDLVSDPRSTMKVLCEFLQLDFDAGILQGGGSGTEEYSEFYDHIHANLDGELTNEYVDRWREDLDKDQINLVEWLTTDYMARLGYSASTRPESPRAHYLAALRLQRVAGLAPQVWKYWRQRRAYLLHTVRRKWKLGLMRDLFWIANY